MNTPVVFVACSNNSDSFLRELRGEMHDIWKAMDEFDFHRLIKFDQPPYDANAEILYDKFSRIGDHLSVFHYSGHANGHLFRTEDDDYTKDQFLALLFGKKPNLVFLNGCSTYGYVDFLLANEVKAVIATSTKINDGKARRFSAKFYESLARNKTLEEAFNEAKSILPNAGEVKSVGRSVMGWGNLSASRKGEACPWGLYHLDKPEDYKNPGDFIPILNWRLISTDRDTLKLPPSSQEQQQVIIELFRLRDAEIEGLNESTNDIAEFEENQKRNWTPERQERINNKIKKKNNYEQKIDSLTKQIEEKRLAFRHRLRQTEEHEVAKRVFENVPTLNYIQPQKVVAKWLKGNPKQQSLLFMLQGTKLCGLTLLQERILDTMKFRFRNEESCLRCTIECNSTIQTLVTEETLWQKLKDDRKVGGNSPEDVVAIIFKQLNNSELDFSL